MRTVTHHDKRNYIKTTLLLAGLFFMFRAVAQPPLQLAQIGNLRLANGGEIKACLVGYRTAGKLNKESSNAILFPTWFTGRSADLFGDIGDSSKWLDTSKYFVIAVDALGMGVSSSPSNSKAQPGKAFPKITIKDMVQSQYRLVTETFKLKKLHAVIGVSMGGMQAFQWLVSYPQFVGKVIPVIGSPKLAAQDLLLWNAELSVINAYLACGASEEQALKAVAAIHVLAGSTPSNRSRNTLPEDYQKVIRNEEKYILTRNVWDWAAQLSAMMQHDIFKDTLTRSPLAVAEAIKYKSSDVLIISAVQDGMVNAAPSFDFGKLLGAKILELTSDCGHSAVGCEYGKVKAAVVKFLNE